MTNSFQATGTGIRLNSRIKPSFITGFHIHPHHSTDYLHMHIICNNKNMKTKKRENGQNIFDIQTSSRKFIKTKDMLYILNGENTNMTNNKIPNRSIYLNNFLNRFQTQQNASNKRYNRSVFNNFSPDHINKIIREDSTILHMDEKCIVFSNIDVVTKKRKNGKIVDGQSCSKIHLLVLPWMPIYNCVQFEEQNETHINLIKHMHKMGVMCGKGIASKYNNISWPELPTLYISKNAIQVFKNGKEHYLKELKSSNNTSNRTRRIKALSEMTENRNIHKNNFHYFTKFSNEEKGKIAIMKRWKEKHNQRKEENKLI